MQGQSGGRFRERMDSPFLARLAGLSCRNFAADELAITNYHVVSRVARDPDCDCLNASRCACYALRMIRDVNVRRMEASMRAQFPVLAIVLGLTVAMTVYTSAFAQDTAHLAAGEAAWDKAGCLQCHGATGEGGAGGEFPAGPSLRKTRLDRAALVEAISCGLPGTPMPGWLDGAYTQRSCYGFAPGPAPDGVTLTPVLGANEVEALADFLVAKIVGR